jgi:hypothetical protein
MRPIIMLIAIFALAAPAHAGILDFFRFRGTPRVAGVRVPVLPKSAPKYRKECGPNGCRLVPVN